MLKAEVLRFGALDAPRKRVKWFLPKRQVDAAFHDIESHSVSTFSIYK